MLLLPTLFSSKRGLVLGPALWGGSMDWEHEHIMNRIVITGAGGHIVCRDANLSMIRSMTLGMQSRMEWGRRGDDLVSELF